MLRRERKKSKRNAKKLHLEEGNCETDEKTLTTEQQKPIDMALQVEDKTEQQKPLDMALQVEDKTEQQKPLDMALQVEDKTEQQKTLDMALQVEDKTEQQKPLDMALQVEDKTEQQKPLDMALQVEDKTEQQKPLDMALPVEDKTEEQKTLDMALQEEDSNAEGSPVSPIKKEQEDSDEERSYGMITPTLLKHIKTILSEYPDDAQIIREMVQNAEDAGATCMKIMCDYRTSVPEGTSDIKQYFKTPGICVYNDAMFSENDWNRIITIYGSVKKEEPLKVGRLGFKSVFHMTDSPVIISGNKLLIIDPLKSENKEQECRVILLKALKKNHCPELTLACIMNRFGFDSSIFNTETSGQYMGTLFWLPLRQKQSTLSSTVYSEEKARRLLTSFEKEASHILLFLKSLKIIELMYNTEEDEPYFFKCHTVG